MTFSTTQYNAATAKVTSGADAIGAQIPRVTAAADTAVDSWTMPKIIKVTIKWMVGEIVSGAQAIWHDILELLKGVAVPVYLFEYAFRWEDNAGAASGVASDLTLGNVGMTSEWTGPGASAYTGNISAQAGAASQIASTSGSVAASLVGCAMAGMAFYLAIGAIAFQCATTLIAAIAALGTDVFSIVGLGLVLGDIKLTPTMIWAASAAVVALIGSEASQMVSLHGQSVNSAGFPNGRWPQATLTGA